MYGIDMADKVVNIGYLYKKDDPNREVTFKITLQGEAANAILLPSNFEKGLADLKNGEKLIIRGPTAYLQQPDDFTALMEIEKDSEGKIAIIYDITKDIAFADKAPDLKTQNTLNSLQEVFTKIKSTLPSDFYTNLNVSAPPLDLPPPPSPLETTVVSTESSAPAEAEKVSAPAAPDPEVVPPTIMIIDIANGNTIGREEIKSLLSNLVNAEEMPKSLHVKFRAKDGNEATYEMPQKPVLNRYIPTLKSFATEQNLDTGYMVDMFFDSFDQAGKRFFVLVEKNDNIMASREIDALFEYKKITLDVNTPAPKAPSDLELSLAKPYLYTFSEPISPYLTWQDMMLDTCEKIDELITKEDNKQLKEGQNKLYSSPQEKEIILNSLPQLKADINRVYDKFLKDSFQLKEQEQASFNWLITTNLMQFFTGMVEPGKVDRMRGNQADVNARIMINGLQTGIPDRIKMAEDYLSTMLARAQGNAVAAEVVSSILSVKADPEKTNLTKTYNLGTDEKVLDNIRADIAKASKATRIAVDSINEDINQLDPKQQEKATRDLDKLIKEGNKDIFEKDGSPEDLTRRINRNMDNVKALQAEVAQTRVENITAKYNILINDFADLTKSYETQIKQAQKEVDRYQDPLNTLFARSAQLKVDFENAINFSDHNRKESDIVKEMVEVNERINEYTSTIATISKESGSKLIAELTGKKNELVNQLNNDLANIPVVTDTSSPSAGYLKIMNAIMEVEKVLNQNHEVAVANINNNLPNTDQVKAQLAQHKENLRTVHGGVQQTDKSIFQNTVDMFNLRRYQTALIDGDQPKTHDTYNFWGPTANIVAAPVNRAVDFVQGGESTLEKVGRGLLAVIGFPVIVAVSIPQMVESTFKAIGNFCNAVSNAVGTAIHGAMSIASAGLEAVGKLCDKGVEKLAEVAADKENGIGVQAIAKIAVLTVGTALKGVAAGCHITSNVIENTGMALHEVGTLVGATLRLPTVPLEAGTSLQMMGGAATRAVANTISIATSAVQTVGAQVHDLGDKWNVPGVSTLIKFTGNTVSGLAQSAEAVVQGTRQIITGEVRSGGNLIVENIADAGRKVAFDIQNEVVQPMKGQAAIPELETKVIVKQGENKENINLKELNERAKVTGGKESPDQLADLKKASYDKSHQDKNAEKAKQNNHNSDHGR